jgi:hypothetical protein
MSDKPVKERMHEAAKLAGLCETCYGKLDDITKADFDRVADQPTRDLQFKKLKDQAAQGASAKCHGCSVVPSGDYDPETLTGTIECVGRDANKIV